MQCHEPPPQTKTKNKNNNKKQPNNQKNLIKQTNKQTQFKGVGTLRMESGRQLSMTDPRYLYQGLRSISVSK